MAWAIRDLLAQRWLRTDATYDRANPKQVYYLSMEFLIGRSLANNIINLQVEPTSCARISHRSARARTGRARRDRSRTPGWATAASAGWPPASSTRWPRSQIPAIGYGLRYEYGMFRQEIAGRPAGRAPRQLAAPSRPVGGRPADARPCEVRLNCAFQMKEGRLTVVPNVPTRPARHPLRSARRRLRRQDHQHAAALGCGAATRTSTSCEFSRGDFFDAVHEKVAAEALTRVLYPDDSTPAAGTCGSSRSTSWSPARWPTSWRGSAAAATTGTPCPTRSPSSSTTPTPPLAVAELMRILLDEAGLGWDEAWDLTVPHAGLHQPHADARGPRDLAGQPLRDRCCPGTSRSSTRSTAASWTTSAPAIPATTDRVRVSA